MFTYIKRFILHQETLKVSKFTIIGLACFFIYYFIFISLLALKFNAIFVTVFAYVVSAFLNFILNKAWTFKNKDKKIIYQVITFFTIHGSCLLINIIFVSIGLTFAKNLKSPFLIVIFSLFGDAMASIFSYLGNRFVIFSSRGKNIIINKLNQVNALKKDSIK
ncbi:MAG: GtrA family protein [bacterium]